MVWTAMVSLAEFTDCKQLKSGQTGLSSLVKIYQCQRNNAKIVTMSSLNVHMKLKPTNWASKLHWPKKEMNLRWFWYLFIFYWKWWWKPRTPNWITLRQNLLISQMAEITELPAGLYKSNKPNRYVVMMYLCTQNEVASFKLLLF